MTSSNNPLVSVIVPVYNVEKYMRQCVDSLVKQTLSDMEIILVDDGSTDGSPAICDMYAEKFSNIKVIHKENGGLGYARNTGMEVARGTYIGFLDSDDYVSGYMYETLLDLIIKNEADCAYCDFTRFWGDKVEAIDTHKKEIKVYAGAEVLNPYLLDRVGCKPSEKEDCTYGASVCVGLFKKSILDDNKIHFVSERKIISEDMIFDLEFLPYCKKIVHTNEVLHFYRFNPNSLTTRYVADRFEKNVALCHEMDKRLKKVYDADVYKLSLERYFLKITRIALMEELAHKKENGWWAVRRNIKRIANNEELRKILKSYPIKKLPTTQSLFFSVLKNKMYFATAVLIQINMALKKNR